MIWFACEEHLDYVMDDLIEEYRIAPILEPHHPSNEKETAVCRWCGQTPIYRLVAEQEENHADSSDHDR